MKKILMFILIILTFTGCTNGNIIYKCSYDVSATSKIETIIESNVEGEVLSITKTVSHEDLDMGQVDDLKDNYNQLVNEWLPEEGVDISYELSNNNTKYQSTIVVDMKNIDEDYPIEVLIYGHNGSDDIDDLIESMDNAGMTCKLQ